MRQKSAKSRTKPASAPKAVPRKVARLKLARGATPAPTPKRRSPDDRRAQLIAIAENLFKTKPYAEFDVSDVARAAGITQGLVYHYFPTKEALILSAFELRAAELLAFCDPDPTLPFLEQVESGVKGYIDFVENHGVVYLNLFKGPTAAEPEIQRVCEEMREAIVTRFATGLGLDGTALPATRLSLRGYLGYAEATVLLWLEHRRVTRETVERMLFSIIIAALRIGMSSDPEVPLSSVELADLEASYRRHFDLPR
jgi:AcrR family transcriptional regulator